MPRRRTVLGLMLAVACVLGLLGLRDQWYRSTRQHPHALHHPADALAEVEAGLEAVQQGPLGPARGDSKTHIFIFGDSYTAFGFESEGAPPSIEKPLGNRVTKETLPDQPATYCPKWVDFLVEHLTPPRTLAFNYARGASTVDANLVPPQFWGAKALTLQGREFLDTVCKEGHTLHTQWTAEKSAFVSWMGINDVSNTAEAVGVEGHEIFYGQVVESYLKVMDAWYEGGARRFLVIGVPPLDRTPSLLLTGAPSTFVVAAATSTYNELLANGTRRWAAEHAGASLQFLDTQPIYHRILDGSPKDATCTTPDRPACMWVDMFHPSVKLQEGVAVEVERLLRADGLWA